jgi:hypothetical protein
MALTHKDDRGLAIYNRTSTGQTLYLHSMTGAKSTFTPDEKARHLSHVIDYRLGQWAQGEPPPEGGNHVSD